MENIKSIILDIDFFYKFLNIVECKCHFCLFKKIDNDKNLKDAIIEKFLGNDNSLNKSQDIISDEFSSPEPSSENKKLRSVYPASDIIIRQLSLGSSSLDSITTSSFSLEFPYYFMAHFLYYIKNDFDVILKIIDKHSELIGYINELNFVVNTKILDENVVKLNENIPWDFGHINISNYNQYSFEFLIKNMNKLNRKVCFNIHNHKDFDFKKLIIDFIKDNPNTNVINWKELSIHPLLNLEIMDLVVDTIISNQCRKWNFYHLTNNQKFNYNHAVKILKCCNKKIVNKLVKQFENLLNREWFNISFINDIENHILFRNSHGTLVLNELDRIYYLCMIEQRDKIMTMELYPKKV